MSKENWNECRNLEINGCENIKLLESSCPLEFACSDDELGKAANDPLAAEEEIDVSKFLSAVAYDRNGNFPPPDGCVSLLVFGNKRCLGPPRTVEMFPTWTHPGSPCYNDATMPHESVEDQYCNMKTGNWHETVYMGSGKCRRPHWYEPGHKYNLVFTGDMCSHGVMLKECMVGPCPREVIDLEGRVDDVDAVLA